MFNIVNSKQIVGPAPTPARLTFGQVSSMYWDGDSNNAYLIPARYISLDKDTAVGMDLATMPILRMADGTWHELREVLFDGRMEYAGVGEPGTRFDDRYEFTPSLKALEALPPVANQIEAATLIKSRGPTAFSSPGEYMEMELCRFLLGIETTVYQEWLKGYVRRHHADKYDAIFEAPYHEYFHPNLAADKSNGVCDFNLIAARLGVTLFGIGDGVYASNGMQPISLSGYIKNPMRAFGKLPPIRIVDWEHETFNGTDND